MSAQDDDANIYPTHRCFDDAMEFFTHAYPNAEDAAREQDRYRIVHALCTWPDPDDPQPFAHAWVEETSRRSREIVAWQGGIYRGEHVYWRTPLAAFVEMYQPIKTTRYTLRQAAELNQMYGTYGPWRAEYKAAAIAGRGRRAVAVAKLKMQQQ